jgi:hypothetical protein
MTNCPVLQPHSSVEREIFSKNEAGRDFVIVLFHITNKYPTCKRRLPTNNVSELHGAVCCTLLHAQYRTADI